MHHLYKQNKKLFLSLCTSFFAENISSAPQEKPDKLEGLTLSILRDRKKLEAIVMKDIRAFITSIEDDKKAGKEISQEKKNQIKNIVDYLKLVKNGDRSNEKVDEEYLESKLWILEEIQNQIQTVKEDVSKNTRIKGLLERLETHPQEKTATENAILEALGFLTIKDNNYNVPKKDREEAIKEFQKSSKIQITGIFDQVTIRFIKNTYPERATIVQKKEKEPEPVETKLPLIPSSPTSLPWEKEKEEDNLFAFDKEEKTEEVFSPAFKDVNINNTSLQKYTNFSSLENILRNKNLEEIVTKLNDVVKKDGWGDIKTFRFFSWFFKKNYNHMKDVIEKEYWYKSKGWLDSIQMALVVKTIFDYKETQENIKNMPAEEKFKLLVDFNRDWFITTDPTFYIGEAQALYTACRGLTSEKWMDNVMANLWLGSMDNFWTEMGTKLFLARERFQRSLAVALHNGVKPWELITVGWVKKAYDKKYENQEQQAIIIKKDIEAHIDAKYSYLNLPQTEKRAIVLRWVWVVLGSSQWFWVDFDIKRATRSFVDSLQVWFINGLPWIAFSKELYEWNGFSVWISLVNFVIPLASISYTLEADPKIKELFQNKSKVIFEPSLYVVVSPGLTIVWASIWRVTEKTEEWIEKLLENMKEVLIKTRADLLGGKTFEGSETEKMLQKDGGTSANMTNSKIVYDEMQSAYVGYIKDDTKNREQKIGDLMNAYLAFYRDGLYKNAKGKRLTTLSAGFWLLWWFLPIPFLALSWEKISNKYRAVTDLKAQERERTISKTELTQDQMKNGGISKKTHKGRECIMAEDKKYILSSSDAQIQADFIDENGVKIWYIPLSQNGKQITFSIDESTDLKWVRRTIVIGEGKKDKKTGQYISTPYIPVTQWTSEIGKNNAQFFENTKEIKLKIAILFDGAQKNELFKTDEIKQLQKDIFNYLNAGRSELEKTWGDFAKIVKSSAFKKYAKNNKTEGDLWALETLIPTLKTDEEKIFVLQSIVANLMKKENFTYSENTITLATTLQEYDTKHNRDKYFDDLFAKKYWEDSSLLNAIKTARTEWYTKNGNQKTYSLESVNDSSSMAFVGTAVQWKGWLIPHIGAYNLAKGTESEIPLSIQSQTFIDKLPENFLSSLMKVINASLPDNEKLATNAQVKNFINNKNKFTYKLSFAKIGECLNDALIISGMQIAWWLKIQATATGEVYVQENKVKKFVIWYTWPKIKRKKEETNISSNPWETEVPPEDHLSSVPWETETIGVDNLSSDIWATGVWDTNLWGIWWIWQGNTLTVPSWFNPTNWTISTWIWNTWWSITWGWLNSTTWTISAGQWTWGTTPVSGWFHP